MAIPRTKKPKKGLYTMKQVREKCADTGYQVQLVMSAAIQDVLKVDNDQLIRVLYEAARYSKFYDENLVTLRDVADSIYNSSEGEIDLRPMEMRLRCQKR